MRHTPQSGAMLVPREHGATAMMLTPFLCAALLLRHVYWQEAVTLVAILVALVIKDPLVVLARQRWVWKQEHPETRGAMRLAAIELLVLTACGVTLLWTRDPAAFGLLFVGSAAFTALAVMVNVRNRQRAVWFQVVSAAALSATCVAACLSGPGKVPGWCWLLWLLCTVQATAGIFVVHARLDARNSKGKPVNVANRRLAFLLQMILLASAMWFALRGQFWIATALALAAIGYLLELRRQQNQAALKMSLKRVGQQTLALAVAFALLVCPNWSNSGKL